MCNHSHVSDVGRLVHESTDLDGGQFTCTVHKSIFYKWLYIYIHLHVYRPDNVKILYTIYY